MIQAGKQVVEETELIDEEDHQAVGNSFLPFFTSVSLITEKVCILYIKL
jgi:hypothetical protein